LAETPLRSGGLTVEIDDTAANPVWDSFVAASGGHHTQSSLWGRVKGAGGWRATRVLVSDGSEIRAGAQVLWRPVLSAFRIGHSHLTPVGGMDQSATAIAVQSLPDLARTCRLLNLVGQPSTDEYAEALIAAGFATTQAKPLAGASLVLDLSPGVDDLLAQMKPKCRYNIRLAERKGVTVRQGGEDDLPVVHRLLTDTASRKRFDLESGGRLAQMASILGPAGCFQTFIAEYQSKPVAALVVVGFGDSVVYKRGGWSGEHGEARPNEALHWHAIQWAKAAGYRYYDFDGIEPKVARQIVAGRPIPEQSLQSVTRFKLGFGGTATLLPPLVSYAPGRLLRLAERRIYPRVANAKTVKKALKWLRTH